jgi:hypothetical protein
VTLVGETDNVEPLIGEVLTNVFANVAVVPNKVNRSTKALRAANFLTFAFLEAQESASIRANLLTSLD